MTQQLASPNGLAADLRTAFDAAFSQPHQAHVTALEDFLMVRAGRLTYALRLDEVAALLADKVFTPVPGSIPAMLGIASFRGTILPVYDLRALLGRAGGEQPRWLVLTATQPSIGLAFDQFEGHLRVPSDAVIPDEGARSTPLPAREAVSTSDGLRPIVRMAVVLEAIRSKIRPDPANEEP